MKKIKKRTLNELRQVKTYGYRPPSPSREKNKKEIKSLENEVKIEKKQYICIMETKEKSNWDTYDFQDWVVRNVSILLSGRQLELFIKNNFGYNDLKMFGKLEEAENLKSMYQNSMFDKTITSYSGNLKWTSINF